MIKNVKCPVAVIHGNKDETCMCERGRSLYELAPNKAGFTLVPGAGHCDLLAKLGPVRFCKIVSELFKM
jgi:pimeloyl-ACP methyl ester carboxylesterase